MVMSTMLVIDDDRSIFHIIQAATSHLDVELVFATNATAGLEAIRQYQPEIILMDLYLPGGAKGWDLIHEIKSNAATEHTSIIAFTASGGEDVQKALEAGADDYITKPFAVAHFQNVLLEQLGAVT